VYTVNRQYRAGASWVMNSSTAARIRKLKDLSNQYLRQASLIEGQPDRLLGYPVRIWEQMDDVAANAFPVAFGDFRRAYVLVERHAMRITVDEVTSVATRSFMFAGARAAK
jgi:HK97 family phage major capsid protein